MSFHDPVARASTDEHVWLEIVDDARSMAWVQAENNRTCAWLQASPLFAPLERELLGILDSHERIPAVRPMGAWFYNFWRDRDHVRGVLRRTTPDEFRKQEPIWEIVLDLDAIAAKEGENWVWSRMTGLYPDYERLLISLSRGGGDTVVVREYDVARREFVDTGFFVAAAKTQIGWIDADTVYVGTDFGPGTLTLSGYPRIIKRWQRGSSLAEAATVFEGRESDVMVGAGRFRTWVGDELVWVDMAFRRMTFHTTEKYVLRNDTWMSVGVPEDSQLALFQDQVLVALKSDWIVGEGAARKTWPRGAILAQSLRECLSGGRHFSLLNHPGERKSLAGMVATRNCLLVHEVDAMRNRAWEWSLVCGEWGRRKMALPSDGTLSLAPVDPDRNDDYFMIHADPLTPTSLWLGSARTGARGILKQLPKYFDASGMQVLSYEAESMDGVCIPYCVVTPSGFRADGKAPTLLSGYGGFERPQLPLGYIPAQGVGWLSRGGVYVVAGIRGGGEFGPAWHQAALQSKKQTSYDDFIAVAEDLIARHITSPACLSIQGGSNGGLMVGAVMVQRPDLFRAVVCQVPLLDMRRFNRLLAGASWMAEYGNPDDPAEWKFISRYSPYQNVHAGRRYPRVLFTTSTRDDRVHPGHARKMMARMKEQRHDVWYFENTEGGHALAADNPQAARIAALEFTFLWETLRSAR